MASKDSVCDNYAMGSSGVGVPLSLAELPYKNAWIGTFHCVKMRSVELRSVFLRSGSDTHCLGSRPIRRRCPRQRGKAARLFRIEAEALARPRFGDPDDLPGVHGKVLDDVVDGLEACHLVSLRGVGRG